jgi:DNA repair protein RecN (Recombination protein N)
MLKRLSISNIALVDRAEIEFGPGLSVITGETGAGKSVLVSALALVLGERAEREYVRHGAEQAVVVGEFDSRPLGRQYAESYEDFIRNGSVRIEREVSADGGSRAKISGKNATVAQVKEMTMPIAEILGQHANQMLMNEDNHLLFLDYFGGLDTARDSVRSLYSSWQEMASELRKIIKRRDQFEAERELLLFQKKEIEQASVRVGEEEELINEKRVLDSSRTLMEAARSVGQILDGEDVSFLEMLRQARTEVDRMAQIDKTLEAKSEEFAAVDFQVEDLRRFVEQYGASVPDDPARLDEINERLDELYKLKKKYGNSEQAVLDRLGEIERKLKDRPDTDSLIRDLTAREKECRRRYVSEAVVLSEARYSAADYLGKLVRKELAELAIDNGGFEFEFVYEDDPDGVEFNGRTVKPLPLGLESGRFLFSANPNEPLKSLVKTASGGEISRVLLAMKAAEKKNQRWLHPLLVFDEVDAGIGGQTAVEVGRKLKKLAEDRQVIVISHLHQIARLADQHYAVSKTNASDGRMVIRVSKLDSPGRERELKRMVALPD